MTLLIDLFGYLSILVRGFAIVAQSMALGGVLFLIVLARPFEKDLGPAGADIRNLTRRVAMWSAMALMAAEAAKIAIQGAVLTGTLEIDWRTLSYTNFAIAGFAKIGLAGILALLLARPRDDAPAAMLLLLVAGVLAAATATTHAAARLDGRTPLLIFEALHQLGAAIWIGGIPSFVVALARCTDAEAWRRVGRRFSQMSMAGVALILASAAAMSWTYVGAWDGFYGTAFGVMVTAKGAMVLGLLALGGMNFLLIERLRRNPATPVTRLKRFAEVEIGIGFTLFFAAASLTSVPPAIDLVEERASWAEIVERNSPAWPLLVSPDHADLALPALQAKLDAEAAARASNPLPAFVPGAGEIAPRNAKDIAWSEYNHHWAGLFVLAAGLGALLEKGGLRQARHWPLLFMGLAVFLFLRSDPEVWPLGDIGFFESLRDVEVAQHRVFVAMTAVFALVEWRVRAGALGQTKAAYVFPLLMAAGGALLLTHNHAIANVKEQLLVEITHTPLALAGLAGGWARWLELRLDPPDDRRAGWVWPICLAIVGLVLLNYREA